MSHPQFEAMLFERDELHKKDRLALEGHLQGCAACQQLARNWTEIESRLQQAPQAEPMPGFTARFQMRLEAGRRRRRTKLMIGLASAVMMVLTGVALFFGTGLLSLVSPGALYLLKSLSSLVLFSGLMQVFSDFLLLLIDRVLASVAPSTWLTYSALFSGLVVIWISTMYTLNFRKSFKEVTQ